MLKSSRVAVINTLFNSVLVCEFAGCDYICILTKSTNYQLFKKMELTVLENENRILSLDQNKKKG